MFAVVRSGGKQYRVSKGDIIRVEKLPGDEGAKVTLDEVLMVGTGKDVKVGTPVVSNAKVEAEVVAQTRTPKITVFKKKRRKNYRRTMGHRQDITILRVKDIKAA